MSIDLEYAIKKDVRNNPVLREFDREQKHEFRRVVLLAALGVGMLLFSTWQHYKMRDHGYRIEQLRLDRAKEEVVNRRLHLNLETLRAPQQIEQRARHELGLEPPSIADTVVIERAPATSPSGAIMAEVR